MSKSLNQKVKSQKLIICLEGNIGSGKSTLLSNLQKLGYHIIPEPVNNIWNKFLPLLYSNKQKWSFCFQLEVLHWFHKLKSENINKLLNQPVVSNKNNKEHILIIERSPLSVMEVFTKNLKETRNITEWEYSLIKRYYDIVKWTPHHTIYLKCNPNVNAQRIVKRNRNGENLINNKFIEDLHQNHEILYNKLKVMSHVTIINGNANPQKVLNETVQHLIQIQNDH